MIVLQGSVKLPSTGRGQAPVMVRRGERFPEGVLADKEIERLVAAGILGEAPRLEDRTSDGLPPTRGKWSLNPDTLIGLSAEQLRAKVTEIDAKLAADLPDEIDEAALVNILTADYDPIFDLPVPAVSDRTRPHRAVWDLKDPRVPQD